MSLSEETTYILQSKVPRWLLVTMATQFANQNLKYAIYFGALPNLDGTPIEIVSNQTKLRQCFPVIVIVIVNKLSMEADEPGQQRAVCVPSRRHCVQRRCRQCRGTARCHAAPPWLGLPAAADASSSHQGATRPTTTPATSYLRRYVAR